jgi:hypothetical protein
MRERAHIFDKRHILRTLHGLEKRGLAEHPRTGFWRLKGTLPAYASISKAFYRWLRITQRIDEQFSRTLVVLYLDEYHKKMKGKYGWEKLLQIFREAEDEVTKELDAIRVTHHKFLLILADNPHGIARQKLYEAATEKLRLQKRRARALLHELLEEKIHLLTTWVNERMLRTGMSEKIVLRDMVREEFNQHGYIVSENAQLARRKLDTAGKNKVVLHIFDTSKSPQVLGKEYVVEQVRANEPEVVIYEKVISEETVIDRKGIRRILRISENPEVFIYIYLKFEELGNWRLKGKFERSAYARYMKEKYGQTLEKKLRLALDKYHDHKEREKLEEMGFTWDGEDMVEI